MASVTIGGVKHTIPSFKLREIRAAAPYIDRVLAHRRSMLLLSGESPEDAAGRMIEQSSNAIETMTSALGDTIAVIAIGVLKGRQEYPYTVSRISALVEELEAEISMDEVNTLAPVFNDILTEAGMMKARPTMPGVGRSASPSASESTESSQSSSQPDAPVETGTE